MELEITKVKLTKSGMLEVNYKDEDNNEITLKGSNPVHKDLKDALNKLVPYLADLTEQKEAEKIDFKHICCEKNEKLLKNLMVTGVTISGGDTFEGCTLIGKRTLQTSKVLNLIAPNTGFDPDQEQYEHCEDLRDAVNNVLYEAELYITEKKWSVAQKEIDFDNPDDPFAGGGDKTDSPNPDDVAA